MLYLIRFIVICKLGMQRLSQKTDTGLFCECDKLNLTVTIYAQQ